MINNKFKKEEVNMDVTTVNNEIMMNEQLKKEEVKLQTIEQKRDDLEYELDNLFDEMRISVGDKEYLLEQDIIEVIKEYTEVSDEEALEMITDNLHHKGVLVKEWRNGSTPKRAVYYHLDGSVGFEDYSFVGLFDDGYTEEEYNAIVDNELETYYNEKGILIGLSYDTKNIRMIDDVYSPRKILYLINDMLDIIVGEVE